MDSFLVTTQVLRYPKLIFLQFQDCPTYLYWQERFERKKDDLLLKEWGLGEVAKLNQF